MIDSLFINLMERGLVPDALIRHGIRRLCRERLRDVDPRTEDGRETAVAAFADRLRALPVALVPEKANEQHYELPAAFFTRVLGENLKYSSCQWDEGTTSLDEAERAALATTCERADLVDGQDVLELGCGWGSLTLWMASKYPRSRITAVSNSSSQREFILARAAERGLDNLRVVTADVNGFAPQESFDRVVSVEMFEHVSNYEVLLERIASWLKPGGKLFVHVFCHAHVAYPFETERADDWMGRHFFTGGIMPSRDLLRRFSSKLRVSRQWDWNGSHYQRTAEAWVENLDRARREIEPVLREVYGDEAPRWFHRWRVFFLACAELFGYRGGEEWFVTHMLFEPVPADVEAAAAAASHGGVPV